MELIAACECAEEDFAEALEELKDAFAPGARGLELRELAGGWTLATAADTEQAARRLLSQAAHAAAVARPGRDAGDHRLPAAGLAAGDHADPRRVAPTPRPGRLLERGLIEESGRSPFGAVLYRTTPLFLKLFGMASLDDLPEVEEWDPTPEEEADLRERLLRAGEARAGSSPTTQQMEDDAIEGDAADPAAEGLTPEADAEAGGGRGRGRGRRAAATVERPTAAAEAPPEAAGARLRRIRSRRRSSSGSRRRTSRRRSSRRATTTGYRARAGARRGSGWSPTSAQPAASPLCSASRSVGSAPSDSSSSTASVWPDWAARCSGVDAFAVGRAAERRAAVDAAPKDTNSLIAATRPVAAAQVSAVPR